MFIAVPSSAPGGLDAEVADHFGHCDAFTLVHVHDGVIGDVHLLVNAGHAQGGCMAPVMLLKEQEVDALVAGGMGMRPLSGFQQVGITVYFKEEAKTVREAVELVAAGEARVFGEAQTCGGGEGHCGGHDHHHEEIEREPIEGKADVRADRVVTLEFAIHNGKGELIDASEQSGPMQYLHGHENLPDKLEEALAGHVAGDQLRVELSAADAYGERDESLVLEVARNELPARVRIGQKLRSARPDGSVALLTLVELDDDTARLDSNHPLAGQELTFEVTVVQVERATADEIEHGHIH